MCAFERTSAELKFSKSYSERPSMFYSRWLGLSYLDMNSNSKNKVVAWCREGSSIPSESFTRMSQPLSQIKFQLECSLPVMFLLR